MQPTVARTVLYKLSAYDAESINQRRRDAGAFNRSLDVKPEPGERGRSGHVLHTGNEAAEGDVYPAVVVRTFLGSSLNLQVLLDGNDTYWATSRAEGDGLSQWSWPAIQAAGAGKAPKLGDMVHYASHGSPVQADGTQAYKSVCRTAFVTELTEAEVNEQNPAGDGIYRDTVGLMVANPTGQFFAQGVLYGAVREGGTWHRADH